MSAFPVRLSSSMMLRRTKSKLFIFARTRRAMRRLLKPRQLTAEILSLTAHTVSGEVAWSVSCIDLAEDSQQNGAYVPRPDHTRAIT